MAMLLTWQYCQKGDSVCVELLNNIVKRLLVQLSDDCGEDLDD